MRTPFGWMVSALFMASPLTAQVAIDPPRLEPASWERLAVRVANQTDSVWVGVRVEVPDVVQILGVDAPAGWVSRVVPATETTPQAIEWTGGRVMPGMFNEFAFLGRLRADVREKDLYFPVRLTRETGTTMDWRRGGDGPPVRIAIAGTTRVSSWGALALAGAAFGLAALALAIAVSRRS